MLDEPGGAEPGNCAGWKIEGVERNPVRSIIFHAASMAERVGHQRSNPKINFGHFLLVVRPNPGLSPNEGYPHATCYFLSERAGQTAIRVDGDLGGCLAGTVYSYDCFSRLLGPPDPIRVEREEQGALWCATASELPPA